MIKPIIKNEKYYQFAPAKINLALHIIGKRRDNYHLLDSLVVFADIGDELIVKITDEEKLIIKGDFAAFLPDEKDNLIIGAIKYFKKEWPNKLPFELAINLTKNLPLKAGLGGGSADCAAMLRILAKIAKIDLDNKNLQKIALKLGADVPVCLGSKPAIMQGVGEKITPIKNLPRLNVLLINPQIQLSTKQIFNKLENCRNSPLPKLPENFSDSQQFADWLKTTRNDLAEPAIISAPIIGEIIDSLNQMPNCLYANMSGSGSSIFALFDNRENAILAKNIIKQKWAHFWLVTGEIKS